MSDQPNSQSELAFMLGRIQGDVKHILTALTQNQEQFSKIDTRLTTLERFQWKVVGVATVIPIVLTALGMWLG